MFVSTEEASKRLREIISDNPEAETFLQEPDSRLTARVLVPSGTNTCSFRLNSLFVHEEARIRASSVDIVYFGGNGDNRFDSELFEKEKMLSMTEAERTSGDVIRDPPQVQFEQLVHPVVSLDIAGLIEMYQLCFTDYLVSLDETLIQEAARNSIFCVARNTEGRIIASAIGESLRVGSLTFLEISEEAAHPILRVRGAASGCARRVITEGKCRLEAPVVAFWEARMWHNVLAMGPRVGLTQYGGVLHQHCHIASSPEFTSLPNGGSFGSLAVFYAP